MEQLKRPKVLLYRRAFLSPVQGDEELKERFAEMDIEADNLFSS